MTQSIISQLINDLDALYTRIIRQNAAENRIMSRKEICEIISKSSAPRLYVTAERARRLTFNFNKYCAKQGRCYRTAAMNAEVYRRVLELPKGMRTIQNIESVINQPAPSFYLSPSRINQLLYKAYDRDRNDRRK